MINKILTILKIKKKILSILLIFFITVFFILFFDLLIGNYVYKKILRKNFFDIDTGMGTIHPVYHHDLRKNYITHSAGWGKRKFSFCTDNHGFRNDCKSKNISKNFDIGIIGDSQTAGYGLSYDEMFSTLISKKLKNKRIANLSTSSYSPAIYYSKINYFLEQGYKFKEIIVFVDLSDFHDDFVKYKLDGSKVMQKNKIDWSTENHNVIDRFMIIIERKFKVTNYLVLSINNFLIEKNLKKKKIPHWVLYNPRSTWSYNYDKKWYLNEDLENVINNSIFNMDKLYRLLDENNIPLSIVVFPWPSTLKFDKSDNLQVKIWRDFCNTRCKNFFNIMTPFFEIKKNMDFESLYFKYYIEGDIHLNENGNKIIAKYFLENYKD